MTSRAGTTLASLAAIVALSGWVASCALVTGISHYTRSDCEGDCDAAAIGSGSADGGADAIGDATVDAGPVPFSCGGVTCAASESCCGSPDGGALRCGSICNAREILVNCNDESQCAGNLLHCCGDYDPRFDETFSAIRCMDRCTYPLCPQGTGCPDGTVCKPLFPPMTPICTPL